MLVNHDLRTIFIHIPKTGGSSVETILFEQLNFKRFDKNKIHRHCTYKTLISNFPHLTSYYFYAVIRNPIYQQLSLYNFLLYRWLKSSYDNDVYHFYKNIGFINSIKMANLDTQNLPHNINPQSKGYHHKFMLGKQQYYWIEGCDNLSLINFNNLEKDVYNIWKCEIPHKNKGIYSTSQFDEHVIHFFNNSFTDDFKIFNNLM